MDFLLGIIWWLGYLDSIWDSNFFLICLVLVWRALGIVGILRLYRLAGIVLTFRVLLLLYVHCMQVVLFRIHLVVAVELQDVVEYQFRFVSLYHFLLCFSAFLERLISQLGFSVNYTLTLLDNFFVLCFTFHLKVFTLRHFDEIIYVMLFWFLNICSFRLFNKFQIFLHYHETGLTSFNVYLRVGIDNHGIPRQCVKQLLLILQLI